MSKIDNGKWLEKILADFVNTSPDNVAEGEQLWDSPLVGFSKGSDSYYSFFKQDIGDFFLLPEELIMGTYPGSQTVAEELTVVSWILPQTELTKEENAANKEYPGRRWARSRLYGEEFNRKLAAHLVTRLGDLGFRAVAPMLSPLFANKTSVKYGYASTWSERHAAFTSGLGTFGLCDGLITPVGKAMRCGSVILQARIEPTMRKFESHHPYCQTCMACVARCPVGAIDKNGHNKTLCRQYVRDVAAPYIKEQYRLDIYGCGLCQTGVPCADGVPK